MAAGFAQAKPDRRRPAEHTLLIPNAGEGLGLILQAGALVDCLTWLPLTRLLDEEFMLDKKSLSQLDVFFLDGKPVDDPDSALVPDGSRLALAGGLPGIAGLAMRKGSALAGLRPGITFIQEDFDPREPTPGRLEIALFSLALRLVSGHFLKRGVLVDAGRLLPYLRPALAGDITVDGRNLSLDDGRAFVAGLRKDSLILLRADVAATA